MELGIPEKQEIWEARETLEMMEQGVVAVAVEELTGGLPELPAVAVLEGKVVQPT